MSLDTQARRAVSALRDSAEGLDPFTRLRELHTVERRRARAQVALALLLLVALVAAGVLVGRGDPPVVGPLPRATVPVGRQPTTVAVGAGAVWVANTGEASVSRIDPRTNQVVATVPAGDGVNQLAVGPDAVWAGGSRRGVKQLLRIDPRVNRVVAAVPWEPSPSAWP